jgi:carbamoyltransferase
MGLAPYGSRDSKACKEMVDIIKTRLVTVKDDGSIFLHQEYFNYATGLRMVHDDKWETLFGFKKRESESPVADHHCNMALAIQIVTEEIVLKMAQEAKRVTGSDNICMAGGVALNCVANGKLHEAALFKNIFVQPAAGDAGGALGAAFAAWYIYLGKERIPVPGQDAMQGSFLGPAYNDKDIIATSVKYNAVYRLSENMEAMTVTTAKLIAEGNVIGWFQGRMEFGPRALGARSILADARNPDMQKRLNLKIKYRESFRPFAPSVLAEDVNDYFDLGEASPYMMLVKNIKQSMQYPVPDGYASRNLQDKLYFQRSDLPAVTHVDYSARIQTVHKETNPAFCQLLYAFKQQTGCSVLINTSFNVRGEPIVNTPAEAYRCFMETEMDYLVMGNYIFSKQDQPAWKRAIGKQIELSPD